MSEPFDPYRKWLGIPPKDQPPNHYRLLAVEWFEDDPDIISNAADRLMAHVRTFQTGPHSAESQKLLNELAAARHCLLDPAMKAAYDRALRDRVLSRRTATPQPQQQPQTIAAPVPLAAAPLSPVALPQPAPVPVMAPQYPQPVQPFAAPQQPAAPYATPISTALRARRKSAGPALAAIVIVAAALVIAGNYLVQLKQKRSLAAAPPADRQVASRPVERSDRKPQSRQAPAASPPNSRSLRAARQPPDSSIDERGKPPAVRRRVVQSGPTLDLNALAGKMAVGSVDLLRYVEPSRDAVRGVWRLVDGKLISPDDAAPRLAIAYRLPPEYMLKIELAREQGEGAFAVGLVAGDHKAAVVLDGWGAKASGLHLLDGQSGENNPSTYAGRVLAEGQTNTLVFTVNLGGLRVAVNGEPVIDYEGDFERLSWPDEWRPPAAERLELIGSDGSRFAISKLELTTISDPSNVAGPLGSPPELSSDPSKTAQRRSNSRDRRTLGGLVNGPQVKAPLPERQELERAERQARELFGVELSNAAEPGGKQALAEKLLEKAGQAGEASADRYVLLDMARNLAADGGSAKIAARAANEMANWFEVAARELQLEAFAKTAKTAVSPQAKQELFDAARNLIDDFVAADEFDKAAKAAGIAQAAARALKNPQLTKQVAEQKRESERIAKAYLAIRAERERLAADENDPQANAAVGKFYGLTKGDWPRALPYLARGADPVYKALAERDLADPHEADAKKALADEWWKLGESEKGAARKALFTRAGVWYRQAAPFLAGLDKETVQKRLAEVEADAPAGATIKYLVDLPAATVFVDKNWLGQGRDDLGNELRVNNQATPKGLFTPPPDKGFASVTYLINKKALLFTADVGLNAPYRSSSTPLIFEVYGDGGLLWRSKPIKLAEDVDHCEAPLGKVQLLELRVLCVGSNSGAKAVWVEPRLTLK